MVPSKLKGETRQTQFSLSCDSTHQKGFSLFHLENFPKALVEKAKSCPFTCIRFIKSSTDFWFLHS